MSSKHARTTLVGVRIAGVVFDRPDRFTRSVPAPMCTKCPRNNDFVEKPVLADDVCLTLPAAFGVTAFRATTAELGNIPHRMAVS